ncbi:hypothetical protein PNEG_02987 [Pneumocystis murina B123]|uniref:Uncharacterized protein n=1 Tax=Pneumocystis murina (strain B123) TaxID=1069680 RepID=M7P4S3_PNEMU|nr:hypothetical protein PNEG_02414 [Pneumocystis murina B123]XP_007875035.1 hypothetical protein PNEG_02987 [Pneumocystis murina B123]EMR08820.1 hypothetical protein PNEG_02987 [Pneumocystis murina B123]EMR09471.1 hypothetical protein PNEG_02414 [Pneumocystis murina B123]
MPRIFFFLSGTILSSSITYILLLQMRSTTCSLSESLTRQSFRLKNHDYFSNPLWMPMVSSANWMELVKERWNNTLRFISMMPFTNIIKNDFLNKILEDFYFTLRKK